MANIITILRVPYLFAYVAVLYFGSPTLILWAIPALVVLILMDTLDGVVARKRGEVSLLGSILDIAIDRTVEITLWVAFAHLGLVSVVIPLLVIARGTLVDAIRAAGMTSGLPPFKQVRSKVAKFLVSSPFMRTSYGIAKGFAFGFLNLTLALQKMGSPLYESIFLAATILSWLAVSMTVARGVPVLVEGMAYFKPAPPTQET
jgi:CDP-diacylglycerol--glycerol-3-phosphate 3-phosphatidyltransferase